MFAATPFVICHNLGFIGGKKTERRCGREELVTSQPSYIRASDVIYISDAWANSGYQALFFPPDPALEPGDEASTLYVGLTPKQNGHPDRLILMTSLLFLLLALQHVIDTNTPSGKPS